MIYWNRTKTKSSVQKNEYQEHENIDGDINEKDLYTTDKLSLNYSQREWLKREFESELGIFMIWRDFFKVHAIIMG